MSVFRVCAVSARPPGAAHHFAGEALVGQRAARFGIVEVDRLAMARRLGQAHVARDDRAQHLVAEMLGELQRNFVAEVVARVVHGAHEAFDFERGIEAHAHGLDRVEQVGQAFESEVFALHGNEHAVRGGERVNGEQAERRRTVDEHGVVAVAEFGEVILEARFARQRVHELDLGGGEVGAAGQQVEAGFRLDDRVLDRRFIEQHVAAVRPRGALVNAGSHRRIRLRIHVDEQHAPRRLGERRGEVDRRRRLADAAFLVGDRDDAHHGSARVP
jgi:hypothetical protein